ncbi:MAG TPA: hypothetical protein VNC78_02350 [Actinomycetota bacterium]|nr:hypothetical protein [Actinomycetota bacterium]
MTNCAEVREQLPALIDDGTSELNLRRHLSRCAGCRDELARYDTLRRSLATMSVVPTEPPPGLLGAISGIPGRDSRVLDVRHHVVRNKTVYVGGAVAVVGALGALAWRSHRGRVATA